MGNSVVCSNKVAAMEDESDGNRGMEIVSSDQNNSFLWSITCYFLDVLNANDG